VTLRRCDHAQGVSAGVRRKVLDLLTAGRSVALIAFDLQISEQTIYSWRRQDRTDSGQLPGISSTEHAELVAARRRIAELETVAGERLPVLAACRVVDVTESGYYAWRLRVPSARSIRHTWLTDAASRQ